MADTPIISLDNVSRRFAGVTAVDGVSFDVARGEFLSLLGPSGCGKTTTLRLLAGFETPEAGGTIRMLDHVVNDARPWQRPIGMVFQNYALFPHLDVGENVAFGLRERRVARSEIRMRVARALELVRLDPAVYLRRKPAELSGGQRQRVALARALVLEPPILLLDEPLGALDLQLRKAMQLELRELNRTLGTTFIFVTHDQEEALTMSDRVAVMSGGRLVQIGTPIDVYRRPRTEFVATFIGEANLLRGVVESVDAEGATVRGDAGIWRIPPSPLARGDHAVIAVRPEWHRLVHEGVAEGENALRGTVRALIFRGASQEAVVALEGGATVRVVIGDDARWCSGDSGWVTWRVAQGCLLK